MARVTLLLLAALLLAPSAAAQVGVPPIVPGTVGAAANQATSAVTPVLENATGEELTQEDVEVALDVIMTNAEYQVAGILAGGGKVQLDMSIRAHLEFRAVSVARLDEALRRATSDHNASVSSTLGLDTRRVVLTAEEVRTAGGGMLLRAFQAYQEDATRRLAQGTLPGLDVLAVDFAWSNTAPAERPLTGERPRLSEPPLVLDVQMTMRFVDRIALADFLTKHLEPKEDAEEEAPAEEDPREGLKRRIKENQTLPLMQRSAFVILAIDQLLAFSVEPGWRLRLTLTVPRGYTVEGATDELVLSDDRRSVTYIADGSGASVARQSAGVASLSSRPTVMMALLALTVGVGLLLRTLVETLARHLRRTVRLEVRDAKGEVQHGVGHEAHREEERERPHERRVR